MMFVNWLKKWHWKQVKNMLFTRKMKSTTSAKSSTFQQVAQSNISHHNTIFDCPIWNYNMAIEKKDSRYLYILTDYSKLPEKKLDDILDAMWWAYMDEKGIDSNFKLAYDLKIRIAELEFQKACGLDKTIQIAIAKQDLEGMFKGKKQKLSEQLAILSKFMGYQLNPKVVTVYDFIGIENLFIESNKKK